MSRYDPIEHIFGQLDHLRAALDHSREQLASLSREVGEIQVELAARRQVVESDQEALARMRRQIDRIWARIGGSRHGSSPMPSLGELREMAKGALLVIAAAAAMGGLITGKMSLVSLLSGGG